jgi:hypothetical protein
MQGGEPLSVRSSAKRVKRGNELGDSRPQKHTPPPPKMPGLDGARAARDWRD